MKRIAVLLCVLSVFSPLFAKTYSEYLTDAKKYESQKKWVYALDAYYDAMGTDGSPESKQEAYEGYKKLTDAIEAGNPGLGKFNDFTLHDEWKKLLMESEVFFSSFNPNKLTVHELKRGDLDYKTKTATYTARIDFELSDRYLKILPIIADGYESARKDDWTDLPKEWPRYSVSNKSEDNGAKIIFLEKWGKEKRNINPFVFVDCRPSKAERNEYRWFNTPYSSAYELEEIPYVYNFIIVDEKGKELIKSNCSGRILRHFDSDTSIHSKIFPANMAADPATYWFSWQSTISFSGITPDIMILIDEGKAFVSPTSCYLEYGQYSSDYWGAVKPEKVFQVKLPKEKSVIICWNNKEDRIAKNVAEIMDYNEKKRVVNILLKELGHIARGEYEYGIYKFGEERYFENKKSFDLFKDKRIYYESFGESYSDKELVELAVELEYMFPEEKKAWLRGLVECLPKGWDKEPVDYYEQKVQFLEDVCKTLVFVSQKSYYYGVYNGKQYFYNEEKFNSFKNDSYHIQGKSYRFGELIGFVQANFSLYTSETKEWINHFTENLPEGWNSKPTVFYENLKK